VNPCDDGKRQFGFVTELLAEVDSRERKTDMHEWTVLQLYRTDTGKFVAVRERWSVDKRYRPGTVYPECDWVDSHVSDTTTGIVEWLGWSWLTKSLYDRAGIAPRQVIP